MSTALTDGPYVGPKPFCRSEAGIFFGRDAEASEVLSLILAHRACVLYAQSGAGKSSLLNAKLVPGLEGEGFEVLGPVRVHATNAAAETSQNNNIYVQNVVNSLGGPLPAGRQQSTLFGGRLKCSLVLNGEQLSPRVLILDQYEEIFTTYPERWRDRAGFFAQLAEALWSDELLRILFVMREDHIAKLDPYTSLFPEDLRIRFRLERLQKDAATLAVQMPLMKVGISEQTSSRVAENVVTELLQTHIRTDRGTVRIEGQFIEPVLLQVVCQRMWERYFVNASSVQNAAKKFIDSNSFVAVDQALTEYYETGLRTVLKGNKVTELQIRKWFRDQLITAAGTRSFAFKGDRDVQGMPNHIISQLEACRLIRSEYRAGAQWFELTHDSFISPIQASNEIWFNALNNRRTERVIFSWIMAYSLAGLLVMELFLPPLFNRLTLFNSRVAAIKEIEIKSSKASELLGLAIDASQKEKYVDAKASLAYLRHGRYLKRADIRALTEDLILAMRGQRNSLISDLVYLRKRPQRQSTWSKNARQHTEQIQEAIRPIVVFGSWFAIVISISFSGCLLYFLTRLRMGSNLNRVLWGSVIVAMIQARLYWQGAKISPYVNYSSDEFIFKVVAGINTLIFLMVVVYASIILLRQNDERR